MSGTTKRTVSDKIEKLLDESPATPEQVIAPSIPKIKLLAVENYQNYAIGDGINWKQGTIHEVDFNTYQRILMDNENAVTRV